ncbi:hypothetical protein ELI25_29490 (plasmid) [Rhizobium ruizarguesonis]|uniref:hypothetical protein n=1 Tax=Rhizobium ruizarguesonis TaxID=2081791 RepID=UPI0010312FB2|nr:hypothetical protein [Rhizobium ruizarguesonis]TAW06605.1 hypothetical protein ELI25_29490 [Rhizobium ruizarguesonis]
MNIHAPMFSASKEVSEYRFAAGDGFLFRGHDFSFVETLPDGYVIARVHDGLRIGLTKQQMAEAFEDKRDPIVHYPGKYSEGGARAGLRDEAMTTKLSAKQKSILLLKKELCDAVLKLYRNGDLKLTDESMALFLPGLIKGLRTPLPEGRKKTWKSRKKMTRETFDPSPRTVRDWLAKYRRSGQLVSLVDDYGNNAGTTRLGPELEGIVQKYVHKWATTDRAKRNTIHQEMCDEIEKLNNDRPMHDRRSPPDIKTFRRRIKTLPPAFVAAARNGVDAGKLEYSIHHQGLESIRPLERTEMDEWVTDLQTVLALAGVWKTMSKKERAAVPRMRLYLTGIIDVASECMVSAEVHRKPPSVKTSVAALEMATMDKTAIAKELGCFSPWDMHGTFELIATDSASWYVSDEFRWTVNDLGAILFLPPTGAASARGTIERFFRTCSVQAFEYFSGRTWGSVSEKGLVDAEKEATIVFEQARALILRFVVDVYHNTKHNGGETPRDAWKRLKNRYGVLPSPTGHRRRAIFGSSFEATITASGFTWNGVPYQSNALQHVRRNVTNKVLARVDRYNLGTSSFFDGTRWYTASAKFKEFEGMTAFEWAAIKDRYSQLADQQAELSRETLQTATADLRNAGKLARLLAALPQPGFTEEDYERFEERLGRQFKVTSRGPVAEINMAAEWRPSANYLELIGLGDVAVPDDVFSGFGDTAHEAEPPPAVPECMPVVQSLIDPDFDAS